MIGVSTPSISFHRPEAPLVTAFGVDAVALARGARLLQRAAVLARVEAVALRREVLVLHDDGDVGVDDVVARQHDSRREVVLTAHARATLVDLGVDDVAADDLPRSRPRLAVEEVERLLVDHLAAAVRVAGAVVGHVVGARRRLRRRRRHRPRHRPRRRRQHRRRHCRSRPRIRRPNRVVTAPRAEAERDQ